MTRLKPEKKGYYKLVWEDMDLEKLFDYKLEKVFKTREDEKEDTLGEGITFRSYLSVLFSYLDKKLQEGYFKEGDKDRLVLEEFLLQGAEEPAPSVAPIE